ncbi:MAG: hypothetical protein ACFE8N_00975, partial [Promethearchaeota archaeon]
ANAVQPEWYKDKFQPLLVPGKVKVTAFVTRQCCSETIISCEAKKAADSFGKEVAFEEIDMSIPGNKKKYGFNWRIYVDDENLFTDHKLLLLFIIVFNKK